jgi:hypothetical protein
LFVATSYARQTRRVSSYVKYLDQTCIKYGKTRLFVRVKFCFCDNTCSCTVPVNYYAIITNLKTSLAIEHENVKVSHFYKCVTTYDIDVVPLNDLLCVMFKVSSNDDVIYLSEPLNRHELE